VTLSGCWVLIHRGTFLSSIRMVLLQGFESKMLREKPESVKGRS